MVGGGWERLRARLFTPVDAASLGAFRMMFGWLVAWQVVRTFAGGQITELYGASRFHFTYLYFEWVRPLSDDGMHEVFQFLGICGVFVCAGLFYRAAIVLVFIGVSYVFLLEQALYLNHMYLFSLVAFLLCFLGGNRWASVDGSLFGWRREHETIPFWQLFLLRAQMFIIYFYAGVAKLNGDWLRAVPVRDWALDRSDAFLIGPLMTHEATPWLIAYLAVIYDLSIGFLLLWRRTRALAIVASFFFHVINKLLFGIGIFPEFAFAATLLFLDPDWPRRILAVFAPLRARFFPPTEHPEQEEWAEDDEWEESQSERKWENDERPEQSPAAVPPPVDAGPQPTPEPPPPPSPRKQAWVLSAIGAYLAIQILMPLRHWLYPGDVNWTEEGHRYSWRMKLREKQGSLEVTVRDPDTGRQWKVDPADYLPPKERRAAATRPDMTQQFAHYIRDVYRREKGIANPEVYCRARATLNDSVEGDLIDPSVNLAAEPRNLWPKRWIVRQRPPRAKEHGSRTGTPATAAE